MKFGSKLLGSALVAILALGTGRGLMAREGADHKHEGKGHKMAEKLGLSEDEAKALREARKKHFEAMKPLREKRKALMENLEGQVRAKAADSEISATLGMLETLQQDIEAEQGRHRAEIKSLLKPTQQAKVLLGLKHQAGKNIKKRMKEHKEDKDDDEDDHDH